MNKTGTFANQRTTLAFGIPPQNLELKEIYWALAGGSLVITSTQILLCNLDQVVNRPLHNQRVFKPQEPRPQHTKSFYLPPPITLPRLAELSP
jgi:hypothetical protein